MAFEKVSMSRLLRYVFLNIREIAPTGYFWKIVIVSRKFPSYSVESENAKYSPARVVSILLADGYSRNPP